MDWNIDNQKDPGMAGMVADAISLFLMCPDGGSAMAQSIAMQKILLVRSSCSILIVFRATQDSNGSAVIRGEAIDIFIQ
ncbi:hypothetical protein CEXT_673631 [Caerostris extrusa]|uniref:Uncharacterized protein n=1 Tax=Caerostris extrusa TaxID=172846 RepID=A0AAV4SCE8_CAEEX|nr:hypothetical protein CEXT_673631 [Caerostris extrusa]